MNAASGLFRRPNGQGWLWLLGGPREAPLDLGSSLAEIERSIGRPRAFVIIQSTAAPSHKPDELIAVREWLGAATSLCLVEQPSPNLDPFDVAWLVGGSVDDWLEACSQGEAEEVLLEGLGRGLHLLASGEAAETLGSWAWSSRAGEYVGALGWLPGAFVVTGKAASDGWTRSRGLLAKRRRAYGLSIPPGDAVGLGPNGEVRLWGEPPPGVLLGPGWNEPAAHE